MKKLLIGICLLAFIFAGCQSITSQPIKDGDTWFCPKPHDILEYKDGSWECVYDGADGPAPSPAPAPAPAPEPSPEPSPEPEGCPEGGIGPSGPNHTT